MKRFSKPSDIKVGVVGYGSAFGMGGLHLGDMAKAGMTPVAVADVDETCLATAAKDRPGIETYSSLTSMLRKSDVNLIVLITPHNTHAKLAVQALNAGRHVVCEKPMAITTAECDAMIAAAKKNDVMLSAYHNRHWDGCIMQALKAIRKGAIGEVYRIEAHMGAWAKPANWWRSSKSISGGILYDWGVHLLEYGLQIIDSDITEVTAFAKNGFWAPKTKWKADTIEDEGHAVIRFKSGQWMTLCVSQTDSNPKDGQLEITGTKGTFVFDYNNWKLIQPKNTGTVITKGKNPPHKWAEYYRNIADHLAGGKPLVITGQWSRRPIHILDLACKSAQLGKSLKAKYK